MREAASLEDSTARAVVYGPLALAAIAGGRLALAETLAERASGEPRVRAFHKLAVTEREHGLLPNARRHITSAVEAMDPVWRCDGCIVVVTAPGAVAPIPGGMERQLIGDVAFLALQLDLRPQVLAWAAAQRGSAQRASAYLAVVEGMSRLVARLAATVPDALGAAQESDGRRRSGGTPPTRQSWSQSPSFERTSYDAVSIPWSLAVAASIWSGVIAGASDCVADIPEPDIASATAARGIADDQGHARHQDGLRR